MRFPSIPDAPASASEPAGAGWAVPHRALAWSLLALVALEASSAWLPADRAMGAALQVVSATIGVGILPGGIVALLWRPKPFFGLLEWLAISIAVSFGLVHVITVLMILTHVGVPIVSVVILLATAAGSIGLLAASRPSARLRIAPDDVLGVILLIVAGALLYVQGSPADWWEDQIHVSIVRRLAELPHPRLDNLFLTPGLVYAYPFPSTHAFMSLVTNIGHADALFVYHKLRFFWGVAALLMVYLGALAVFERRAVASAALMMAGVLALAGVFAEVPGGAWGQLTPFSHTSDVAMGVLLPALLALTYAFIEAPSVRESRFLLAAVTGLAFALTVVHIREVIQYLTYLGCFVVIAFAVKSFRPRGRRALLLMGVTLAVAALFVTWQRSVVTLFSNVIADEQAQVRGIAAATSWHDLLLAHAPTILPSHLIWFDAAFHGATQWLLLAAPIAVVAFRRRPLVWLIAGSTVAYLLVMNVPALAIAYLYVTYYEILFTPIRNITPFLYLLAGPIVYVLVASLWTSVSWRPLAFLAVLAAGAFAGAVAFLAPLAANRSEIGLFLPAVLAWSVPFLFLGRAGPVDVLTRSRKVIAVMAGVIALLALLPDHAPARPPVPVNVRWAPGIDGAARATLERRFSLVPLDHGDVPDTRVYELRDLSRANVQALVSDPAVADTHHINRVTFDVEQPPRPWDKYPGRALFTTTAVGLVLFGFVAPYRSVMASQSPR